MKLKITLEDIWKHTVGRNRLTAINVIWPSQLIVTSMYTCKHTLEIYPFNKTNVTIAFLCMWKNTLERNLSNAAIVTKLFQGIFIIWCIWEHTLGRYDFKDVIMKRHSQIMVNLKFIWGYILKCIAFLCNNRFYNSSKNTHIEEKL